MTGATKGVGAAARFWLYEFWGPKWDWHRRSLLLRAYRAYLRHSAIPAEHLPDPADRQSAAAQEAFSAAYARRVDAVQTRSAPVSGVHLTYRPIGKNLRLLGTAVRAGVDRGNRVAIRPDGPPDEVRMLAKRGQSWLPWLWARTGPGEPPPPEDAALAWNELFMNPPARPSGGSGAIPPPPRLESGNGTYGREHLELVLKVAAATRYVFSPRADTMSRIHELKRAAGWPQNGEPVLGIHVRRGDAAAATANTDPAKATRKSFALATYLERADQICRRYDIRHIFLATESGEEIERASSLLPQYKFLWLDYDRTLFPDIRTSAQFIEDMSIERPERARPLAVTGILDLYCFCECSAFVGAFNSEFSVLGWLLVIGSRGRLVPYVSLSHPSQKRHLHPHDALLNLQNNCPLELYHW